MNMQNIQFNADTSVTIISHDNRRWLTAEDVGRCLGYGKGNERDGINRAFQRHIDEFLEEDSVTVKLTATDGKSYNTRIFSETGCIKLGFFSNTHTAKSFRKWAAKVLSGSIVPENQVQTQQIEALKTAYLQSNPDAAKLLRYHELGLNNSEIAKLLGVVDSTVGKHLRKLAALGLCDYQYNVELAARAKLAHAKRQEIKALQQSLELGE